MLESKVIKEIYRIKDKKVYAVYKETNEQREVNGCEVRAELARDRIELENHRQFLKSELERTENSIAENLELDNQLEMIGYCKIDHPVYKKIDGVILKDSEGKQIISKFTHQNNCVNKERKA